MSKNPLFMLVGTFYRSFQRLYIINLSPILTLHRNFFETFLFFIHFQSFMWCIKKRPSAWANDLLVSGLYFQCHSPDFTPIVLHYNRKSLHYRVQWRYSWMLGGSMILAMSSYVGVISSNDLFHFSNRIIGHAFCVFNFFAKK